MAILRLNYVQRHGRTKGGSKAKAWRGGAQASTQAALRAARYYRHRDGPDLDQRVWHDAEERRTHQEVLAGIREHGHTYDYMYRVVLSTKEAALTIDAYRQVAAGHFERYYLIEHRNTDYPHAHLIGFRNRVIKDAERAGMYQQLAELEQGRARELAREVAPEVGRSAEHGEFSRFDDTVEATQLRQRAEPMTEVEQVLGRGVVDVEQDFFTELEQLLATPGPEEHARERQVEQDLDWGV